MVIALIALFVSLGGSAAALSGSNTVFTDDLANDTQPASGGNPAGGLVAADLRPNSVGASEAASNSVGTSEVATDSLAAADLAPSSVGSSEITNGTVSVLDTNTVIPSGATVTGAFNQFEDVGGNDTSAFLRFSADFHGLRAPTALTDADINFDDTGISAAAADPTEENPGCTGGLASPTAPPGEVCIYLFHESVINTSAEGEPLGFTGVSTEPNDKGFAVEAFGTDTAALGGTWAYQAP